MAKQKVKIDGLMKKAKDAVGRRNYDLAIFSYIEAIKLQPDNVEVRTALRAIQTKYAKEKGTSSFGAFKAMAAANVHKMLKKYDDAIIDLENGLTSDPSNLKMLVMLAELCVTAGYTDVAIWQRQSIADNVAPEDTDNLFALADLYKEAGKGQETIGCLERIKEIDPEMDIDAEMREASAQMSSIIFERAAKEGSRAIIKNADEADKLEMDAGRLRTDDQRRKAIDYRLEHDLKDRPKDHAMWLTIGDIAASFDDLEAGYGEAMKYYKKAEELSPANSAIRDHIGDLEMRRFKHRIQSLDAAAKGGDAAALEQLKKLRKEDLEYQLEEYKRRVKEQPLKADYHYKLGTLFLQFHQYDDAIGELQVASKDPRFKIGALTFLGRCMLAQKNIDMAISQFTRAREGVELFDKYKEPMYYEALAYLTKGTKEGAQKALELFTHLYETDIKFRDVKDRVAEAQKILNQ